MLKAIKRWFKSLTETPTASADTAEAPTASTLPLGLASGHSIEFDDALRLLLDGQSHVPLPTLETVWSHGTLDLGQSTVLHRFYMNDDDYWLQVLVQDGEASDIILFSYDECVTIASEAELKRLVGPESDIGLPDYVYNECEFVRQWGTEQGQTELTPMLEQVTTPEAQYQVRHLSMLYARDTGLTERREFLLFSVEEDDEGIISLSTSLGVTLKPSDLRII